MKSQWKNRKSRNTPPPTNSIGFDNSIDSATIGSELNEAVNASTGPSPGLAAHIITNGRMPLIRNTAIIIPQNRNHFLARLDIVRRTSALMTALSREVIISKSMRPNAVRIKNPNSMLLASLSLFIKFAFLEKIN